jgi:tetratricopeptide (TPR) repeat protein
MGRYEDALYDFMRSNDFKPDHHYAIAGQAAAYLMLGETEKAKAKWQTLIGMDARYQDAGTLQAEYKCTDALAEAARQVAALVAGDDEAV